MPETIDSDMYVPEQDSRRLASDTLVNLIHEASDDQIRNMVKAIEVKCTQELIQFCKSEVMVLESFIRISGSVTNAMSTPQGMVTVRSIARCLALNSDQINPGCMDAMIAETVDLTQFKVHTEPPKKLLWSGQLKSPENEKKTGKRHHIRHHDNDNKDDSSEHPLKGEIKVNFYNNGEYKSPHDGRSIDSSHHRHHSDVGDTLWILIFPIFCLGLLFSLKYGRGYLKRRQSSIPAVYCTAERIPLSTSETP